MIELQLATPQGDWLEVTWTDVEQLPDVEVPEQQALFDAEGNQVQPAVAAHTKPGGEKRTELKHVSYHKTQLAMLQADADAMGTPLDAHIEFLTEWSSSYVPPVESPQARWERIKAIRDELMRRGGFPVGNYWFHSDQDSRVQILGLVQLGNNIPQGLQWKTMSGEFVPMTSTLAKQVLAAAALHDTAIFTHAEYLRANPSADETQGWPTSFIPNQGGN